MALLFGMAFRDLKGSSLFGHGLQIMGPTDGILSLDREKVMEGQLRLGANLGAIPAERMS